MALRERLMISGLQSKNGNNFVNREIRVFIACGQPVMWFFDNDLKDIHRLFSDDEIEKLKINEQQYADIHKYSKTIGQVFDASFIVADFAILQDGQVFLIETNPGHCSGWPHPAAYVGVYGQLLNAILQQPSFSKEQLIDLCNKVSIELCGLDKLYGFY